MRPRQGVLAGLVTPAEMQNTHLSRTAEYANAIPLQYISVECLG